MADAARRIAGFASLQDGINAGIGANLIPPTQAAQAVNVTFRGDFPQTRPTWKNHILSTPATWTGIFQGSMHYDGEAGQSGWLVMRGGRLFFVTDDTFIVSDVTPQLVIVTTQDFVLPGAGNQVSITINGNPTLTAGQTIVIAGLHFTVNAIANDQVLLTQIDASPGTSTTANFTQPNVGDTVVGGVAVIDTSWAIQGEPIQIVTGGLYKVTSITDLTHFVLTNSGGAGNAAPTTVLASPLTVTGGVAAGTTLFDNSGNQLITFETYPPTLNFVYMFQAENYGIILGGHERTIIWDGQQARLSNIQQDEVPSGFLGAYGWGRIWIVRPDRRTFVAGDIVFGPSGTPQNGFRDAILKFTENDFLNEGGSFGVPYNAGPITAMQFLATQDTSLGIGVLLVGTTNMVFSVNAPTDRSTWKNLTYPIQTVSLIDYGPRGPRSTISVNGDMWYRSEDGIRSFIVARRLFGSPGNTPMSHEIDPILDADSQQMLFFSSAVFFDTKLYFTVQPFLSGGQVEHRGLVVMNFDLVSDLRTKQAASWEGVNTGLNILQIGKARIDDMERCFMWAQGSDIELWEIGLDGISDEFSDTVGNMSRVRKQDIACILQTRAEDYGLPLELKRLVMAEIYLEDVADTIQMSIAYSPDQYCGWIPWASFSICSTVSQCTPNVAGCIFQVNARAYAARLTLPQPADTCNPMTGKPAREFHDCQFQITWTGHCRIRRFFTHTILQTQKMQGECPPKVTCLAFPCCDDNLFIYDSHPAPGLNLILGEGGEPILGEGGEFILSEG